MLLRFRVSNYRSINDLQEFSMVAGDVRRHYNHIKRLGNMKVLKFSALFGANAGGKSNVVKAMETMRDSVLEGCLTSESMDEWCQLDPANETKPSTFEMDFNMLNTIYTYGFAAILAENKIVSEWLYKHDIGSNTEEEEIFTRTLDEEDKEIIKRFKKSQKVALKEKLVVEFDVHEEILGTYHIKGSRISEDDDYSILMSERFGVYTQYNKSHLLLPQFSGRFTITSDTGWRYNPNGKPLFKEFEIVYYWYLFALQIIKPLPIGISSQDTVYDKKLVQRDLAATMLRHIDLDDIRKYAIKLGLGVNGIKISTMTEADIKEIFTEREIRDYGEFFPNIRNAGKQVEKALIKEKKEKQVAFNKAETERGKYGQLLYYIEFVIENFLQPDVKFSYHNDQSKWPWTICAEDVPLIKKSIQKTHIEIKKKEKNIDNLTDSEKKQLAFETGQIANVEPFLPFVDDWYDRFIQYSINAENCSKRIDAIEKKLNSPDASLTGDYNFSKSQTGSLIPIGNALIFCSDDPDDPYTVKIEFTHGSNKTVFRYGVESDGTKRMMELIEILCTAKAKKATHTFVVDEIDRSLHPQLTYRFVKEYLEALEPEGEIQLFITTHEAHILDMSLVRQDEIWIADKQPDGATSLYSLSDFKNEHIADKDVVSRYLDGRYGGVPLFDALFPMEETPQINTDVSDESEMDSNDNRDKISSYEQEKESDDSINDVNDDKSLDQTDEYDNNLSKDYWKGKTPDSEIVANALYKTLKERKIISDRKKK